MRQMFVSGGYRAQHGAERRVNIRLTFIRWRQIGRTCGYFLCLLHWPKVYNSMYE